MEKKELIEVMQGELKAFKDNLTFAEANEVSEQIKGIEDKINDLNVKELKSQLEEIGTTVSKLERVRQRS